LVDNGKPKGLLTGTDQTHYQSWTRFTYNTASGVLEKVDRYHDIPGSGVRTLSTNYYRTVHQFDTRGRQQYEIQVVSGTVATNSREQVTQAVYDVLDRVTEIKRGVSADSAAAPTIPNHDMGSSYISYPTLYPITVTVYDGGGVGDGHVSKERRYHSTTANDYTGANYSRNFRGHLRGVEPIYVNTSGVETAIGPFTVHDVNWLGATTAAALYTSNPTWSSVISNDTYAASTASNRHLNQNILR
jgi:hypothetical protein